MSKTFKILPKQRNFAKSGHTVSHLDLEMKHLGLGWCHMLQQKKVFQYCRQFPSSKIPNVASSTPSSRRSSSTSSPSPSSPSSTASSTSTCLATVSSATTIRLIWRKLDGLTRCWPPSLSSTGKSFFKKCVQTRHLFVFIFVLFTRQI